MIPNIRQQFNQQFTPTKYQNFLDDIAATYNHRQPFRVAETPIFIPNGLKKHLFQACDDINEVLINPNFMDMTKGAIEHNVPGESDSNLFIQMDFAVTQNEAGELIPQLIEAQGFPSLYFFQDLVAKMYRKHYDIPSDYTSYFNGLDSNSYMELLRKEIVGNSNPENVVVLELDPTNQATYIDFLGSQHHLGIPPLCISDLKKEGKDFYYIKNGRKIGVEKIFHRAIFDEIVKRPDIKRSFKFTESANVEWIGHPNWFFRLSKYTMPFLDSPYVPKTHFLHELKEYPKNLQDYVLKPLYSFSGAGVKLHITRADLDAIQDKQNFILQEKIEYAPVVASPTDPVKCEIRMLMLWTDRNEKPKVVTNLARLSRGEMIGVRYNKDKDWVGGSVGFFEKDYDL